MHSLKATVVREHDRFYSAELDPLLPSFMLQGGSVRFLLQETRAAREDVSSNPTSADCPKGAYRLDSCLGTHGTLSKTMKHSTSLM